MIEAAAIAEQALVEAELTATGLYTHVHLRRSKYWPGALSWLQVQLWGMPINRAIDLQNPTKADIGF